MAPRHHHQYATATRARTARSHDSRSQKTSRRTQAQRQATRRRDAAVRAPEHKTARSYAAAVQNFGGTKQPHSPPTTRRKRETTQRRRHATAHRRKRGCRGHISQEKRRAARLHNRSSSTGQMQGQRGAARFNNRSSTAQEQQAVYIAQLSAVWLLYSTFYMAMHSTQQMLQSLQGSAHEADRQTDRATQENASPPNGPTQPSPALAVLKIVQSHLAPTSRAKPTVWATSLMNANIVIERLHKVSGYTDLVKYDLETLHRKKLLQNQNWTMQDLRWLSMDTLLQMNYDRTGTREDYQFYSKVHARSLFLPPYK